MPSWTEFRLAVQGLLRLARFNPDFTRFFDHSPAGALRSFWLAAPILPYSLLVLAKSGWIERASDMTQFTVAMAIGYAVLWLLPPAILTWIAPTIGRQPEMPGCIAMYNWMSLLSAGANLPLIALEMAGVPYDIMIVPYWIVVIVSRLWEAFLLAQVLRIALWQAALASIADFLIMVHLVVPMFLVAGSVI